MDYIFLLRYVILALTIVGLILLVMDRTKIKTEFAPFLTFTILISTLFVFGLLNMLLYWVVTTIIISAGAMLYLLIKKRFFGLLRELFTNIAFIISIVLVILLSLKLQNIMLTHYDNFTHWALAIKNILYTNQISGNITDILLFKTYPPGSALFVYYGCKIIGFSEPNMLIMQMILTVACVQCIFAFINKKYYSVIIAAFLCITMLMVPDFIENLLVDALLGIMGASASLAIMYYRKETKKACLYTLPILISIVLVKNSGIFFLMINIVLLVYFELKYGTGAKKVRNLNFIYILLTLSVSALAIFAWSKHVDFFYANRYAPHDMSISYYSSKMADKTAQNAIDIAKLMLKEIPNWSNAITKIWVIINSGLLALILIMKFSKNDTRTLIKWSIYINAIAILYFVGVYTMYIFSMPLGGSLIMAGYDRYMITISIYILAIGCIILFDQIKLVENKFKYIISAVVFIILILSNISYNSHWFKYNSCDNDISLQLEDIRDNRDDLYDIRKYLVYASEFPDSEFLRHLIRYKFFAPYVDVVTELPTGEKFEELIGGYNYLLVLNEDLKITSLLKNYTDKGGYIGLYPVKESFLKGK